MVLVVVVGDLHFKKDTPTISDLVIHKITEEIEKIKPDIVVFLGDILDTHEKIDLKTQNRAIKFIKHIAAKNIQVFVIIGNHERPDGTSFLTEDSSLYCLKGLPNIHVADRVLDLKWEIEGHKDKVRFVFAPYVPPGKFHEALDTLEEKVMSSTPPACIFCHQEFKGCQIGGYKSKGGDEWPETNPLIISGHIHTFQILQNNIVYAGTPYQQSWSDESEKGIILAEFLPGKNPRINMLKLDIRRKKSIKLKPSEVDAFVPPPNTDLQIDIVGSSSEIKALGETGIITKMRSRGISVSLSTERIANPSNPQNKPYKELLLDMIKADSDATNMFNEIFAPQTSAANANPSIPVNLTELLKSVQSVGSQPVVGDGKPFDIQSFMSAMAQQANKQTEKALVAPAVINPPVAPTVPVATAHVPLQPTVLPGMSLLGNILPVINPTATPATIRMPSVGDASMTTTPSYLIGADGKPAPEAKPTKNEITASLLSSAHIEKTSPKPGSLEALLSGIITQPSK